ncbi:ABC transporter substrate-binding protein [Roseovarius sp. CAU 1744]|uniref:ABC transporter substrate-binding protein n=1 Tax=Roseovarius sp. CAU 1744 TaxID=3140368 RepID=UPI00325A43D6
MGLAASAARALDIRSAVFRIDYPVIAPISRFDAVPEDLGFAGARLADEDNATTGQFLGHTYETLHVAVPPDQADAAFGKLLSDGVSIIVVLAEADDLLRLADMAGPGVIVVNALARDTKLRDEDCRGNLLHTAPSHAIQSDAVAQFAMWKRWPRWFLIHGSNPQDQALAEAYRRAAAKFGAEIVEEREFEDTGGSRRTDTGHVLVQRQIPVFTQDAKEHDVVIAADASDVFAPYLPFHLWTPRPVLGSAGLRPVSLHPAHEAWGATQFQRRFEALTGRFVRPEDYQAWLGLRVVSEAVTRTGSDKVEDLRAYILSDAFELAAFMGQKVTFRDWNGQLRTPVLLYDGRITASVSPQEGFLHQRSPLDSLGLDAPESACEAFQ